MKNYSPAGSVAFLLPAVQSFQTSARSTSKRDTIIRRYPPFCRHFRNANFAHDDRFSIGRGNLIHMSSRVSNRQSRSFSFRFVFTIVRLIHLL